jgi:hypothetical protein
LPREVVEMALAHAVENKVERPTGAAILSRNGAGWRDGDAYSQRLGEMNGAAGPGRSLPGAAAALAMGPDAPAGGERWLRSGGRAFFGSPAMRSELHHRAGKSRKGGPAAAVALSWIRVVTTVLGVSDRMDRVGLLPEGQQTVVAIRLAR